MFPLVVHQPADANETYGQLGSAFRLCVGRLMGESEFNTAKLENVCCSDCVGVCGNVCCVAAVVKNSFFFSLGVLKYVVCLCRGCDVCCWLNLFVVDFRSYRLFRSARVNGEH